MPRYWQENPNHKFEWGESGGLPISDLTLEGHASRIQSILKVALLVDNTDKAVRSSDGNFILVGNISIIYGGAGGKTPINARERQLERELPASSPAYTNGVLNIGSTANIVPDVRVATDGVNWFASANPAVDFAVGYTLGYLQDDGTGKVIASTVPNGMEYTITIIGGNVFVS